MLQPRSKHNLAQAKLAQKQQYNKKVAPEERSPDQRILLLILLSESKLLLL